MPSSARDDTVNLEDIFSDWFTDDFPSLSSLAAPPNAPAPAPRPAEGAPEQPQQQYTTAAAPMMYQPQQA